MEIFENYKISEKKLCKIFEIDHKVQNCSPGSQFYESFYSDQTADR